MEARNCKECGKIFNYLGGAPVCAACAKKLEERFAQVKEFVYDNPGASINEVAEENEVSVQQIKRWIREERLAFSDSSDIGIDCEKCGAMIRTGRYCNNCKRRLEEQLGGMYKPAAPVQKKKATSSDARMRFLDGK